ncbi:MAG: 2OG-Fe(II) oxygenase [Pseudomonas sp.]|uniref:2OG-Fe(II) oxygenase family protein n=1 Tax=Pseudomonas sp. TaxID=306 RepID=UPI0030F12D95
MLTTTVDGLTAADITDVINAKSYGIHIKGFADADTVQLAKERLSRHELRGTFSEQQEFNRLGKAYIEINDEQSRQAYHAQAVSNIRKIRDTFRPLASPIDELRLLLDEVWPKGARLLDVNGEKCFVGIARFQGSGVDLTPHTDNLERNAPSDHQPRLLTQLSTNIYLEIPEDGGELEIWGIEPDEAQYERLRGSRAYGIERDLLPPPDFVIKPEPGDLIVLNPRLIHAVRPSATSTRVTLGVFIGYFGEDQPMAYRS